MARTFDDGSSQYLISGSTPATAAPFSVSCWFYSDENPPSANQSIISICDSGSSNNGFLLYESTDRTLFWYVVDAGGFTQATGGTCTDGQWNHGAVVETASDDRACYLNGASSGANSTDRTPAGVDRIGVGAWVIDVIDPNMSGHIAEVGIWNAALTDEEVAILAAGYPPPLVRPGNLVLYLPLDDTDREWNDRYNMTPVNGPSWAVHPPKVLRMKQRLWPYPVASMGSRVWAGF